MVMCHCGWAILSWYVVQHYLGCFYGDALWMRVTFKSELDKACYPSRCGWNCWVSWGPWLKKEGLPWSRKNSIFGITLQLSPGFPACRHNLQILDLPSLNILLAKSLKINQSVNQPVSVFIPLSLHCLSLSSHTRTHTTLFLWITLTNTAIQFLRPSSKL